MARRKRNNPAEEELDQSDSDAPKPTRRKQSQRKKEGTKQTKKRIRVQRKQIKPKEFNSRNKKNYPQHTPFH